MNPFSASGALARELVDRFAVETACGMLPAEFLHGDVLDVTRSSIGVLHRSLGTGTMPGAEDIQHVRRSVAVWARDGVPLPPLLDALGLAYRHCVGLARANSTESSGARDVLAGADLYMFLRLEITTAYVEALAAMKQEQHTTAAALMTALLEGDDLARVRALRDMGPEWNVPRCTVVAVSFGGTDTHGEDAESVVSQSRDRRRVLTGVEALLPTALMRFGPAGGIMVVPIPDLRVVTARITEAMDRSGRRITAVIDTAALESVVDVVDFVSTLLKTATRLELEQTVHVAADLAEVHQLCQPGPGRESLARLVRPLASFPELVATLRTYLSLEQRNNVTANALFIHPNTLAYRFKRVIELTGLSPTVPSEMRLLRAALVVVGVAPPQTPVVRIR